MVSLEKLSIATPNYMTLLVESLDLDVEAGGSLLVMGPSGCGKTSLLRAIGGLWDSGQGKIRRPGPNEVMVCIYNGCFSRPLRGPCVHAAILLTSEVGTDINCGLLLVCSAYWNEWLGGE